MVGTSCPKWSVHRTLHHTETLPLDMEIIKKFACFSVAFTLTRVVFVAGRLYPEMLNSHFFFCAFAEQRMALGELAEENQSITYADATVLPRGIDQRRKLVEINCSIKAGL